jgi:hypothetical protein
MALRFGEDGPAISYDYSIMLEELKEEVADGILTLDDEIKVVRADRGLVYFPIVDWFYIDDEEAPERAEVMRLSAVLDEMEDMNEILTFN